MPRRPRPVLFVAWLALFYAGWSLTVTWRDAWSGVASHWPIAAAMAAGSYFAGSTPMGGGTVGFPVLVLLLDQPATLGRDFSFAVQSIGMTSASIFIFAMRIPVAARLLAFSVLGSLVGTPLGLFFVSPHVSPLVTKVAFAVIWCSFAVLTMRRLDEQSGLSGITPLPPSTHRAAGLAIGLLGGAFAAAVTGVGIDMVLYAVLLLVFRCDMKVAIPTSVVIMAFTSLVGIATRNLQGDLSPEVFGNWSAAAPVVALGAPLGAYVVDRIGRRPTLVVVSVLCLLQFVWTLVEELASLGVTGFVLSLGAVAVVNVLFDRLRARGLALAGAGGTVPLVPSGTERAT